MTALVIAITLKCAYCAGLVYFGRRVWWEVTEDPDDYDAFDVVRGTFLVIAWPAMVATVALLFGVSGVVTFFRGARLS